MVGNEVMEVQVYRRESFVLCMILSRVDIQWTKRTRPELRTDFLSIILRIDSKGWNIYRFHCLNDCLIYWFHSLAMTGSKDNFRSQNHYFIIKLIQIGHLNIPYARVSLHAEVDGDLSIPCQTTNNSKAKKLIWIILTHLLTGYGVLIDVYLLMLL